MIYYKLNSSQANLLGRFEISSNNFFEATPYMGGFIVSELVYQELKDTDKFKLINWEELETINELEHSNKKL